MPFRLPALLLLFFLSGAAGLIYEVLWTRQLSLIFGVTTYAVSAVLATFLGGLALGSWLLGRRVDRVHNPLLVYALLELGIGLYALLIPTMLEALRPLHIALAQLGLPYSGFSLLRALLAAAVLLVPTTLMGGTFALLVSDWARERGNLARGTGILYLVNTGGGLVGCVLCGFFLIENFGLAGTNRIAGATNIVLAVGAALLSRGRVTQHATAGGASAAQPGLRLSAREARLILFSAGLSGFVSLAAEVLWSRALLGHLYNSTYAFTMMLATFLLGIAIGSAVFTSLFSRIRRPLLVFAGLQVGVGIGLALALLLFPRLHLLTGRVFGIQTVTSFEVSLLTMFLQAGAILLPPVILLGILFPLATTLVASGRSAVGDAIGRVYAVNTLGAILGSLGCAFVLIPHLGMWGTNKLLVALSLGGAAAIAAIGNTGATRRETTAVGAAALFALAIVAAPVEDVFRRGFLIGKDERLIFYKDGATDTVGVREAEGERTIVYNDKRGTAATSSYDLNFFLGHLPVLLHPGTPRHVLHICFGVGNSLSAVASHPDVERVDSVELSPNALEAGSYFWTNDDVLGNPKVRSIVDDGRSYVMTTQETYDVILLEPPETFTAGVINLYTTEFYRDARARLAPDGVMMQWIPTANASVDDERRLFRAFHDVFPHATMWWQLWGGTALLIGTKEPLGIDYQRLKARMSEPRTAQDMAISQVTDVDQLLSYFRFDEAAFADFVRDSLPVTDDRTVLDFSMPRYGGSGFGLGQFNANVRAEGRGLSEIVAERIRMYEALARPVAPYLTNLGEETREAIAARIEARRKAPITWQSHRAFREAEWRQMRSEG